KELIGTVTPDIDEGLVAVDYRVKKDDSLLGIADLFNVRVSDVRNWNNIPYTSTVRIGQNLKMYVPQDQKEYYASIDNTTKIEEKAPKINTSDNSDSFIYHTIRRGENLGSISRKYGISIAALKQWNDLTSNKIIAGHRLKIYTSVADIDYTDNNYDAPPTTTKTNLYRYKVRKGDTISEIAELYKVSTRMLRKWNGLRSNKIIAGQTLKIYTNEPVSSTTDYAEDNDANVNYYKIKKGDSIGKIADLYKVSVADLKQWNDLTSNKIIAGKTLKIYSDAGPHGIVEKTNRNNSKTKNNNADFYTIKKGDTIWDIADQHGVTVTELKKWNDLTSNKIIAGK
ncbi:MAG: LysM peptidoglycan-binding domain-containing protein, partial [Nitrososphaeraceae archaeon]|nr:LysM peptidoglycan-binding domain-containing protein [Nitrososphaeraceae archaeon]